MDIRRLSHDCDSGHRPSARAARKLPTRNSARDTETWLDALDHLDTTESIVLTVLRRMGSEEDWGPEQTTLLAGLEYLNRVAQRIRHHIDQRSPGK